MIEVEATGTNLALLQAGLAVLAPAMSERERNALRLGGGTALALLWRHRHSTDIDLSMDGEALRAFVRRNRASLLARLSSLHEAGTIRSGWHLSPRAVMWRYREQGPFSIVRAQSGQPSHVEKATGIRLEPVRDILRGKLIGRALEAGQLLDRDGYDLCCAFDFARMDMVAVLTEAQEEYDWGDGLPLQRTGRRGRRLIDPANPGYVNDPWSAFAAKAACALRDSS